jgi:ribosomal protein S18 acetylase RimI-like enzyme
MMLKLIGTGVLRTVEIRPVRAADGPDLGRFFEENDRPEVTRQFRPFPLTAKTAAGIVNAERTDFFCVAILDHRIVAFGMLRGWEDGYEVPSFGVLVDHRYQGRGLGRQMTEFCAREARHVGAQRVRLTVYASNRRAVHVYESLGFVSVQRERVVVGGDPDVKITMVLDLPKGATG